MGYIQGEGRDQGTLFPVVFDDFVPADHVCRVIDAFVGRFVMSDLGFERAEAAETGRPGYDPRDLLKLYLYGYLNQIPLCRDYRGEWFAKGKHFHTETWTLSDLRVQIVEEGFDPSSIF